jgi:DNA-binding response OmpR family regulator
MRSEGQIFNRRQILEQVWGYGFDPSTNVVDVCIKRLRGKLASIDPQGASLIEAVRGAGYLFKAAR